LYAVACVVSAASTAGAGSISSTAEERLTAFSTTVKVGIS